MNVQTRVGSDPAQVVESLSALSICKQGLPAYYRTLAEANDQVLRVAALSALLELRAVRPGDWDDLVEASRDGAVRSRASNYFLSIFEYDLVDACLAHPVTDVGAIRDRATRAAVTLDPQNLFNANLELFLAEGQLAQLNDVRANAEQLGGWRQALPWAARCILAQPSDPGGPFTFLNTLLNANQIELLAQACKTFRQADVYPSEVAIFTSFLLTKQGRAKDALKLLQSVPGSQLDPRMQVVSLRAKAEAFESVGDYRQAYAAYQRQNAANASKDVDPKAYPRALIRHSGFKLSALPPDEHSGTHFVMLGFPRSGTTLLENALAAHPLIETIEEAPALASAINYLERQTNGTDTIRPEAGTAARQRYYREISRHVRKPEASIFVDKMPLHTAEIPLLEQLFPQRRYIFSIRHPYDVVLSCFRQLFKPNAAMENFRTIEDTCRLYDFVMTRWFSVFTLQETERLHYVRYEQLVEDFVPTVQGALRFLGAEWNEQVMRFPELAASRPTRTPSYQKVRGGLTLGVQSSRSGYAFLFGKPETKVLDRWVEHFGYEK